jgi:hypothetical protein
MKNTASRCAFFHRAATLGTKDADSLSHGRTSKNIIGQRRDGVCAQYRTIRWSRPAVPLVSGYTSLWERQFGQFENGRRHLSSSNLHI